MKHAKEIKEEAKVMHSTDPLGLGIRETPWLKTTLTSTIHTSMAFHVELIRANWDQAFGLFGKEPATGTACTTHKHFINKRMNIVRVLFCPAGAFAVPASNRLADKTRQTDPCDV